MERGVLLTMPISGGAAPRTQQRWKVLGSGQEGQETEPKEPPGFGWEDPALSGELRPAGEEPEAQWGKGTPGPTMHWAQAQGLPHAIRIVLAGWVEDPRSQRRHWVPEE